MTSRSRWLIVLFASLCHCSHSRPPEARYRDAVAAKFEGDASRYYNELLALAHEAPTSRAGRRARATLRGGDGLLNLAIVGAAASFLAPALGTYQAQSRQAEAKQGLRTIALAQSAYFAEHGKYCGTFAECGLTPPSKSRYFYFLGPQEVAGGGDSEATLDVEEQARDALRSLRIVPKSDAHDFVAAAVGNADDDALLDVWTIDAANHLVHVVNDLSS